MHTSLAHRGVYLAVMSSLLVATPLPATATSDPPRARARAVKLCKAELKRLGSQRFHDKYGVHSDKAALARCVKKRLQSDKKS